MQKLVNFNVKISVIPNSLEKYTAFTINKILDFIDRVQFMNSSLGTLVRNLSNNGFKHLSQEFNSEFLKLLKQKIVYPYAYLGSFKKILNDKLPDRCEVFSSLKDECISKNIICMLMIFRLCLK